jgi:hypothetical protein
VLFAGTLKGGIYKSLDGGGTWRALKTHTPFTFGMALDPTNPDRIFAACAEKQVIVSEDAGETWRVVNLPGDRPPHVAAYVIAVPPQCPEMVVVGTLAYDQRAAEGLFISEDGGTSFRHYSMQLPMVNLLALETPAGAECKILLGHNGIGLHEAQLK